MALAPNTKLPKCADCGAGSPRVVSKTRRENGKEYVTHTWLCADCEYKRQHPDAKPAIAPPREQRPKRLQKETLFDVRQDAA